ncbi:MAG: RDD family protein [Hyphomicrobiales bacterium]
MQASVPEFPSRFADQPRAPVWGGLAAPSGVAPASLVVRVFAYLVDLVVIGFLVAALVLALFVLGFLSFGLSWFLIVPVWFATPALYSGLTLSSPAQATLGMRLFGLSLRSMDGREIDFVTGAAHALLFYIFGTTMTPFILLVGVFRHDRALLHDLVLRVRLVSDWGR